MGTGQLLRLALDRLNHALVSMTEVTVEDLALKVEPALASVIIKERPLSTRDRDRARLTLRGPGVEDVPRLAGSELARESFSDHRRCVLRHVTHRNSLLIKRVYTADSITKIDANDSLYASRLVQARLSLRRC
jgi:hypothetical protein